MVALNALRDWAMDNNARVEEAIELFKEREKAEKDGPVENDPIETKVIDCTNQHQKP